MGSWGVGIFSNDDASDVREAFRDLIAEGVAPDEATQRLVKTYGIGRRGGDDNDYWLGLAATQHRLGHVVPYVLDRAIAIVDSSGELERWEPALRKRRKAALDKLRDQLRKPPPAPKKVRPRPRVGTNLKPGQHIMVTMNDRAILLRITQIQEDKGGRYPVAVLLDWDGQERTLRKAHRLPARLNPSPLRAEEAMGFILIGEPSDPDQIRVLRTVADRRTPATPWQSQFVTKWSELHRFFTHDGSPRSP